MGFGDFWSYIKDAATAGPIRRTIGHVASGNGKKAAQQAFSHGSPFAASVVGTPEGQPLGPSSGAYAPRKDNPFDKGYGNGLLEVGKGVLGAYSGAATAQGLSNLANGGAGAGGGPGGGYGDVANWIREAGAKHAGMYNEAAARNQALYDPAQAIFDELYGGAAPRGRAPTPRMKGVLGAPNMHPYLQGKGR